MKNLLSLRFALVLVVAPTLPPFSALAEEEDCPADKAWLHQTPTELAAALSVTPPPHPEPDCPFYQAAWRTFLFVSDPTEGVPAFVSRFETIESTFGQEAKVRFPARKAGKLALLPRVIQEPGRKPISAGVVQAGETAGVLIDRDGYPVYYAIHMNDVFTKFLRDHHLTTAAGAQSADPNLAFPTGAIELKSAWKIVPAGSKLGDQYFTVDAQVPRLKKSGGANPDVVIDLAAAPVDVKVALVALHVVFVMGNHSEFIWATFEHTDEAGKPDTAPPGPIPGTQPPTTEVSSATQYLLFQPHTTVAGGNNVSSGAERFSQFDEALQRFTGSTDHIPSSIYRLYPFAKVVARDPKTQKPQPADSPDGQVVSINQHMGEVFAADAANGVADKRRYYRLVGAVWLDKHDDFQVGRAFQNGSTQTSDEGPVAGEDGLSSTAMESFTQEDNRNCFSCHDTQRITFGGKTVLQPKLTNVSHIISKYLIAHP